LACDFRFAAVDAFFVTPFAKIGMSGDYGGSYFMTKLIGPAKTKELYMLSVRLSAEDALCPGVDHVTQDSRDAMQAFAEKRKPRFSGV